jgi:hypothetical protein
MSAEEKNKLDELFKSGLDTPDTHAEYNDQDWDNLEHLMDAGKRRRGVIYWLPRLGAVAAVLLLFLGWWLFKPAPVDQQVVGTKPLPVKQSPADTTHTNTGTKGINNNNAAGTARVNAPVITAVPLVGTPAAPLYTGTVNKPGRKRGNSQAQPPVNANKQSVNPLVNTPQQQNALAANDVKKDNAINNNTVTNADNTPAKDVLSGQSTATVNTTTPDVPAVANPSEPQIKKLKVSNSSKFRPQFGLAMMVSPDINGAGSFKNSQVGANIGVLFSVGLTKRLTISTGAAYSKKPYATTFDNYYIGYKFKNDPQSVSADCRVLDIPLNVDYKVYSKSANSLSVGSGLSSYIMLKEKYFYDYAIPGTSGPSTTTIINRNRHFLGVLNLNATYEHRLNSKFSVAAQPYLKIPLTDIGNSKVKLQSAGFALGLRWNINQSITP